MDDFATSFYGACCFMIAMYLVAGHRLFWSAILAVVLFFAFTFMLGTMYKWDKEKEMDRLKDKNKKLEAIIAEGIQYEKWMKMYGYEVNECQDINSKSK